MHRFIVYKKIDNYFYLDSHHLKHIKALRIRPNKDYFLCNYKQEFYKTKLINNKAIIVQKLSINNEFDKPVVLLLSIIKPKNFELVVQKATELGCNKIYPVISKYVEKKYINNLNLERLNKIAISAAEQSFRNKVLIIEKPLLINDIDKLSLPKNKYLAYELANQESIIKTFTTDSVFFIGPEGGLDSKEIDFLTKINFKVIKLNKTILRSETAAIKVLSQVIG